MLAHVILLTDKVGVGCWSKQLSTPTKSNIEEVVMVLASDSGTSEQKQVGTTHHLTTCEIMVAVCAG